MKTKLFLAAMAAVAVIGCQKEPNAPSVADGQASFMKVELKSAGAITKATTGTYEDAIAGENTVSSVTFYFFDQNGGEYVVQGKENYMTGTAGDLSSVNDDPNNIDVQSGIMLVIKQHADPDDLPAKMVAVLNAPASLLEKGSMSLQELEKEMSVLQNSDNTFVMSNSVYLDNDNNKINYTAITKNNLFKVNLEEGQPGYNAPGTIINADSYKGEITDINGTATTFENVTVEVYVERVAAKVRVAGLTSEGVGNVLPVAISEKDKTQLEIKRMVVGTDGKIVEETTEQKVWAKVLGWDVTNTVNEAYLLKNFGTDDAWKSTANNKAFGFEPWNVPTLYRSYWAMSTSKDPVHNLKFNDLKGKHVGENTKNYDYYYENTAAAEKDNSVDVGFAAGNPAGNKASQLLVAVQLCSGADAASAKPMDVARWYGKYYTIDALKSAMIATVDHRIFKKVDGVVTPITFGDVVFVQVPETDAEKRYNVVPTAKTDFSYFDVSGASLSTEKVNEILKTIDPAQMWGNENGYGLAYYYTTISHFGDAKGIVRNHIYDINITTIAGLGTPVYNPGGTITPEEPEDNEALNLSARINILTWHVVQNDVTLGN